MNITSNWLLEIEYISTLNTHQIETCQKISLSSPTPDVAPEVLKNQKTMITQLYN